MSIVSYPAIYYTESDFSDSEVSVILKVPISVVIPAYNSERYIQETIGSVLSQSVSVDEIIVVDNNCTDRTIEIAETLGAKIIKEPKQNISASRNAGIRACRNDWIALLDHDDLWEKDKIKTQWEIIQKCPDARIISADIYVIEEDVKKANPMPFREMPRVKESPNFNPSYSYFPQFDLTLYSAYALHTSSMVVHREVFEGAGMYDETFCPREDLEFQLRMLARYPIAVIHQQLSAYRLHSTNTSKDTNAVNDAVTRVIRQAKKYPERYLPQSAEFLISSLKTAFIAECMTLAEEKKKSLDIKQPKDN